MNYHCPICALPVDEHGFPVPAPEIPVKSTPRACVGHRLQAAREQFRTRIDVRGDLANVVEQKVEIRFPYCDL